MALSLADELAAFDDQVMGGGGMSLADEFGLDMDMGPDHTAGLGTDLESELNGSAPTSPAPKPKRKAPAFLHGSTSQARGDADVGHTLEEIDETVRIGGVTGARSAKSSSSSMYGSATTRSGFDETDIDALLENSTNAGDTTFDTAPMPSSPVPCRSPARTRLSGSQIRSSPASGDRTSMMLDTPATKPSFLGHKAEKDPLVELSEILDSNKPFLDLIARLDESRGGSSQLAKRDSGLPTSASSATLWDGGIESKLQRHLDRLHDDDRLREEQCRELAVLHREVGNIRWDSIEMQIELELASGQGLGLGIVDEAEEEEAGQALIGWTGEPGVPSANVPQGRATRPVAPELDSDDRVLGPSSPLPTSIPLSPLERNPSTAEEEAALPRTSHMLVTSTPDLVSTLQHLAEAAHSSGSMTTSSMRQLRGIRAGVDSWRERETMEEDARRGVEEYERKRLEQGLKGALGERAADKMQRECLEFQHVLDDLESRMEQVRREGMFRKAIK